MYWILFLHWLVDRYSLGRDAILATYVATMFTAWITGHDRSPMPLALVAYCDLWFQSMYVELLSRVGYICRNGYSTSYFLEKFT